MKQIFVVTTQWAKGKPISSNNLCCLMYSPNIVADALWYVPYVPYLCFTLLSQFLILSEGIMLLVVILSQSS